MQPTTETICLEGNAGCGKTTCGSVFATGLGGVWMPEYTETLDDTQKKYLMNSYYHSMDNDESAIWLFAENWRFEHCLKNDQKPIVLDTSLVSVVAFSLARRRFGRNGNIASIICAYQRLLSEQKVIVPTKLIHLWVSEDVRIRRLSNRGVCHPFLLRSDVSEYIDELRRQFFKNFLPGNCWASVDVSNLNMSETLTEVERVLNRLDSFSTSESFVDWLGAIKTQFLR